MAIIEILSEHREAQEAAIEEGDGAKLLAETEAVNRLKKAKKEQERKEQNARVARNFQLPVSRK